jgi:hypothetical protein
MEYESDIEAIIKGEVDREWQSLSPEQVETLRRYNVACENDGFMESARRSKLGGIAKFGTDIGKPYEKITREDLEEWFVSEGIEQPGMAVPQKRQIKRFFQWLYGYEGSNYPPVVDWIREVGRSLAQRVAEEGISMATDVAGDVLGQMDTLMPTISEGLSEVSQPTEKEKKKKKQAR